MKRILLASAAALAATGAIAADLPSRKAPPPEVYLAPPIGWGGAYGGVSVGGVFGSGSTEVTSIGSGGGCQAWTPSILPIFSTSKDEQPKWVNPCYDSKNHYDRQLSKSFLAPVPNGSNAALSSFGNVGGSSSGFIGGGQLGYNGQWGSVVAGIETDISGIAGSGGTGTVTGASSDGVYSYLGQTTVSRRLSYLGTLRGRLGYLVTPTLLLYGTAGMAYGGTHMNTSVWGSATPVVFPTFPTLTGGSWFGEQSSNSTRVGWTAGAGGEWMFAPHWSVGLGYLYYDLGRVTYQTPWVGANGIAGSSQTSARFTGNLVRASLNYHFAGF